MPFVYEIDNTDRAILKLLVQDGKMAYTEIAERIHLSHGTIHQRVKKLEKRGIIKKTSVVLDYSKLGYNFIFFLGIIVGNTSNIQVICRELQNYPEITVAHLTSGKFNILCKLRTLDSNHASKLIQQIQSIKGIIRTESTVSFNEFINSKEKLVNELTENK